MVDWPVVEGREWYQDLTRVATSCKGPAGPPVLAIEFFPDIWRDGFKIVRLKK